MRFATFKYCACLFSVTMFAGLGVPCFAQGVQVEVHDSVSSKRIVGWEHELTEGNPNLAHWHWEPISTSSHHRTEVVRTSPTDSTPPEPVQIVRAHYVKPIHVALPATNHGIMPTSSASNHSSGDVNGQLLTSNNEKRIMSYGAYSTTGSSSKSAVAGKIVHMSGRHTADAGSFN